MNAYEIISIFLAAGTFSALLLIGFKTNILREAPAHDPNGNRMYSLGRFQLWLWSVVIIPIFALYWGFDLQHTIDLNTTATLLLGIPAGVSLASNVISSSQASNITPDQQSVALASPEAATLKMHQPSKNFFVDLISDDSGNLSMGRLQQLLFTFTFAIMYITSFFATGMQALPIFESEVFTIMGISSGTYLVAKGLNK